MENKYVAILSIILVVLALIIGAVAFSSNGPSDEEINAYIESQLESAISQATLQYQAEIESLKGQLETTTQTPVDSEVIESETSFTGYTFEDFFLMNSLDELLSDKDVDKLYDDEVEFDGEDYDVEELFYVNGLLAINGDDYEENVYLTFEEGDLVYYIELDPTLNLSEINEDETLVLNFLGKDIEISEWDNDEVTFTEGNEYLLSEGDSVDFEGKSIVLDMVLDDAIYVTVDGVGEKIEEGDTEEVNGVEIKASDVLYTEKEGRVSKAVLTVGGEIEVEVSDGDEYEEDSIWEWQISDHTLGLVLAEDFTELDDRDDFNALDVDGKLCLPNDYLCVEYSGLEDEDVEEYNFEIEDTELIYVKGKFLSGINDYEEIFLNLTDGNFYEDDDCEDLVNDSVYLGDSEIELTFDGAGIYFDDVVISLDLDSIEVDGTDISSEEDNYRNEYGIVVFDPEDSVDDQELKFSVPEEVLQGVVSVF